MSKKLWLKAWVQESENILVYSGYYLKRSSQNPFQLYPEVQIKKTSLII
jgi:hypothetical protein